MVKKFSDVQAHRLPSLEKAATDMMFVFLTMNVINNVLLTTLIAGKIWWIVRQIDKVCLSTEAWKVPRKRYESSVALIVESGLLYPVATLIFEVLPQTMPVFPNLYAIMTQMAGIAPTLIIVRVQLGVSIDSVDESIGMHSNTASLRGSCFEIVDTERSEIQGGGESVHVEFSRMHIIKTP
ncbi:hypothetical protein VKT23_010822 [Stygiomarasmius scandens]|uniref:G protein-coupled receptor n=1 Tax=Marasmiellus scandens TaxID=2682957 RepID=A0ABR1JDP1_9AGAR